MSQRVHRLMVGAGECLWLMQHQKRAFLPLYLSSFGATLHHDVCVSRLFILTGPPDVGKSRVSDDCPASFFLPAYKQLRKHCA